MIGKKEDYKGSGKLMEGCLWNPWDFLIVISFMGLLYFIKIR